MRAQVGDRIVLAAVHVNDATRDGEVVEVHGTDGGPPYAVRWSDGHVGVIYPGPGAVLRVGEHAPGAEKPPTHEAPSTPPADPAAEHAVTTGTDPGHVREWQVRVSIFESGDDTSASVVLLSDSPTHLQARGSSRRSPGDAAVQEIGDELAVARALRHLADQLAESAEQDIEAVTGEPAHVRPD